MKKLQFKLSVNHKAFILFNIITIIFFYKTIFMGAKFMASNLMYLISPWNSIGEVKTSGALLSDSIDVLIPQLYYVKSSLLNGHIPLWNPYIATGSPFYTSLVQIISYPLNWLVLLFPIDLGIFLQSYAKVLISLFGMYLFLGRYSTTVQSRIIGALAYTFSGPFIAWLNWPHTSVACLAPLLFYYVDKAVYDIDVKSVLISIFILTFMFYAGMPVYVAYFLYLLGLYVIFRLVIKYKRDYKKYYRPISYFIIIVIFAGGLSFAYTGSLAAQINYLDYLSQRQEHYKFTLGLNLLKGFVFPNNLETKINFNEHAMYIGIIPIVMVLLGLKYIRENKNILFWHIVSLVLILVIYTHNLDILIKILPVINTSLKSRLLIILVYSLAIASAFSVDGIFKNMNIKLDIQAMLTVLSLGIFLLSANEFSKYGMNIRTMIPFLVIASFALLIYMSNIYKKTSKYVVNLLIIILVSDLFIFGINYNPTVEKSADAIPTTESIEYLRNMNTEDRFIALGEWTLFPNTSMFYGLYDVRAHDFINTSERMNNFIQTINGEAYKSPTRTTINKIDNINPLVLSSTKYVFSPTETMNVTINQAENLPKEPMGEITKDILVEQSFICKEDNLSSIEVLLATYKRTFNQSPTIKIDLEDIQTNKIIYSRSVLARQILDNKYYKLEFNTINNSKNKEYKIKITSEDSLAGNAITAWKTKENNYLEGALKINGVEMQGDLFIKLSYNNFANDLKLIKRFSDGMYIYENIKALERTYISHSTIVERDSNKIIDMIRNLDNYENIIIEKEPQLVVNKPNSVDRDESCNIIEYTANRVVINANLNSPGFVVLTDNDYPGWVVEVDGKRSEIYRTNYLFKSVLVNEGKHNIVFSYVPTYFFKNVFISLVFFVLILLLSFYYFYKDKVNLGSKLER